MIKTTMAHKSGRAPSTMAHNSPGHPSPKSVIKTTMAKTGGRADQFVGKMGSCGSMRGGPGTKAIDGKWI